MGRLGMQIHDLAFLHHTAREDLNTDFTLSWVSKHMGARVGLGYDNQIMISEDEHL